MVSDIRETVHPKAHLSRIKNVKSGLRARTKILNLLEEKSADPKTIQREIGVTYRVVMHHLRLLRTEGTVEKRENKPNVWALTGLGQRRLID